MSKSIILDYLMSVLEYHPETGTLHWKCTRNGQVKIGSPAGYMHSASGYWCIEILGQQYRRNILAWAFTHGYWPVLKIDHINKVRHDDRIVNLREATTSQNAANGHAYVSNKLGERGITMQKGRLRVCLYKDGKQHYAGSFGNIEDAIAARNALAKKLHGEFAP